MTDETDPSQAKKATMEAILAVNAVSASIAAQGELLELSAELDCDTEGACATVHDFIERKRKSIASDPAARLVGIASLLDAVRIDAKGTSLELSLAAPETEIARAIRAALSSAFPARPPAAPAPSAGAPARGDETGASGFSPRP